MSDQSHIRLVTSRDRDRVEAIWVSLYREQESFDNRFKVADDALERWRNDFAGWVGSKSRWMWIAERGDSIIGLLTAERSYIPPIYSPVSELFLSEVYVVPEERRKGVGRDLVETAFSKAREERLQRIRLIALDKNTASLSFWRSVGADVFSQTLLMEVGTEPADRPVRRIGF